MVFTGNANPDLARGVASRLYLELGDAKVSKFSPGSIGFTVPNRVHAEVVPCSSTWI